MPTQSHSAKRPIAPFVRPSYRPEDEQEDIYAEIRRRIDALSVPTAVTIQLTSSPTDWLASISAGAALAPTEDWRRKLFFGQVALAPSGVMVGDWYLPTGLALISETEVKFQKLVEQWKAERDPFSSGTSNMMLPPYQQIIGIGPVALPLIFRELEREVDDWFWALRAITGADPVPDDHLGDQTSMRDDWLLWATQNNYR